MLMTSLVRDADALGSIKVEVVLHYPAKLRHKPCSMGTFRPESIVSGFTKLNKIKTQIK